MKSLIWKDINAPLQKISITDKFWKPLMEQNSKVVIPHQLNIIEDKVNGLREDQFSHAVENFKIAAGICEGKYFGVSFLDSDVYKWIEAVALSLRNYPDAAMEQKVDEIAEYIEKSQWDDGYINTFFTLVMPEKRWTNFGYPGELYCAGHLFEAASEYYNTTGKRKLLDVSRKFADHLCETFGYSSDGKKEVCDGHVEIELGLVKLYKATGVKKYLDLCEFFINIRGKDPAYFVTEPWIGVNVIGVRDEKGNYKKWFQADHHQAHKPVREQDVAAGHAVKVTYLLSAMTDLTLLDRDKDKSLFHAAERIWDNMTTKQMYITGALGSHAFAERFSFDYDLPNDVCYTETCASIGLSFVAKRMFQLDHDSRYTDIMELAMFNGMLVGISADGKAYFYVNPLHMDPAVAGYREDHNRVSVEREKWFDVACCPPNIARFIANIDEYVYSFDDNTVFLNLYIANEMTAAMPDGNVKFSIKSDYPWDGNISATLQMEKGLKFKLALRIPGWCKNYSVLVNGKAAKGIVDKGYYYMDRIWSANDTVQLLLDMPVVLMQARKEVYEDAGKVAIQRGPVVYCLEGIDNGGSLRGLHIDSATEFQVDYKPDLLKGVCIISCNGYKTEDKKWGNNELYKPFSKDYTPCRLTAVPYYMWGNRGIGDMDVWIPVI